MYFGIGLFLSVRQDWYTYVVTVKGLLRRPHPALSKDLDVHSPVAVKPMNRFNTAIEELENGRGRC